MTSDVVILGLVPRTQRPTNADALGWMDGRDKPDHDNRASASGVLGEVPEC
jgi:hypothetical protein